MIPVLQPLPLRRQRDYRLLLSARAVSETGTEVSRLAVPLTAATLLGASPAQMGVLAAATSLPYLLIGLQAGAVADRMKRHRPVMVGCEVISAVAMATIPLAWITGLLNVAWLIAVAFIVGSCAVIFRAMNFPHMTAVVHESQRTEALAGFQSAYSLATVSGPGLAGLLVQLITAPFAIIVNAASFLASAFLIRSIKAPEAHTPAPPRGMWTEIREGLRAVLEQPTLRALAGCGMTINFFASAYLALFVIYALNVLGLPGGLLGALTAFAGVGGLLGAAITPRLVRRFGENRLLVYAVLLFPIDFVAAALASGPVWAKFLLMSASTLITGMAIVAFSVCFGAVVLREGPADLLGRINATMTFTIQGVLALGGLAGGLLGELLGLRPVLWICAAGIMLTIPWIWLSPLRRTSAQQAG
ncbi:putative MFS family arabinose efflux permease [Streptosporangium album]|uniref:Putative MFS family arabinose efflux permease n=1 Tax=Streptosporangium album TaxID=47479 RepID=A0A7W7RY10_9ACTN|nr:MFS transporter [Streptosporangium album]MBB4940368.1 putative MFS family arabinose efflux permease [Streptosporangium album]